ncbi:MAG: aconitase X catalytic domain-containing protein [Thermoprotei archaeon]|nr:aconitase X catalytic domain-containing protein [Thermoprotei archaeon]
MHLTRDEERVLAGEYGEAMAEALTVIVRVGEALGAERLISIKHAHISGVSYDNIGEPGRRFIERLYVAGAKFSVPTTFNPVSYDLEEPSSIPSLKLDPNYVRAQESIVRALAAMGAELELTCTPYYAGVTVKHGLSKGDSIAWGESSAVAYANSVLGLKTNREGGPLALMAAIAGRTYYYGMHIDGERKPRIAYYVESPNPLDEAEAGVLGEIIASMHSDERPPMVKAKFSGDPSIREFLAAVGTASDIPMVHIEGVTPEDPGTGVREVVKITYEEVRGKLESMAPEGPVDIIYIGCPHASLEELEHLAKTLEKLGKPRTPIIVSTSRSVYTKLLAAGLAPKLKNLGVTIARDTCLIVSPYTKHNKNVKIATNSYKAYHYLKRKGAKAYLTKIHEHLQTNP